MVPQNGGAISTGTARSRSSPLAPITIKGLATSAVIPVAICVSSRVSGLQMDVQLEKLGRFDEAIERAEAAIWIAETGLQLLFNWVWIVRPRLDPPPSRETFPRDPVP